MMVFIRWLFLVKRDFKAEPMKVVSWITPILFVPMALMFLGCSTSSEEETVRPNIIFIMTDDHTTQAMSAYGSVINQTPNMDRIASSGIRFDNAFVTNSICAPSRAVILTGKFSHLNGVINNAQTFDGSQQTFPKLLQGAGYQTAMVGKWHLRSDPTGFDYWNILPGQGHYYNPDFIEMGERSQREGYVTTLTTDYALDWVDKRDKEKPFYLMLHHKAPHRNWMPDTKHLNMYDDVDLPMPDNFFDSFENRGTAAETQEMSIVEDMYDIYDLKLMYKTAEKNVDKAFERIVGRLNPEQRKAFDEAYADENEAFRKANLTGEALGKWRYQRYIKDYLRCVASVDDNIGRVLDYLEANGLRDNTIIVYTSDQGFYLGEHGWFDKRFMYEESYRTPFIVSYPKTIDEGTVSEALTMNIDVAPTLLEYAGVEVPDDLQGRSLKTVMNNQGKEPEDWREATYYHYYEYPAEHAVKRHYGVRTKDFKLMHFYHDVNEWELYDLRSDPKEMKNVFDNAEYQDIKTELLEELREQQKLYGDSIQSQNPVEMLREVSK